jgi:hypothetical protein
MDPSLLPHFSGQSLTAGDPPIDRPVLSEFMLPIQQRAIFARADPGFDFARFDRRLKSLQVGNYKLIASQLSEPELYDLSGDPQELENIAKTNPAEAERLRLILMDLVERWEPRKGGDEEASDEETLGRLRTLGYVD